jgi:hypothetical protein
MKKGILLFFCMLVMTIGTSQVFVDNMFNYVEHSSVTSRGEYDIISGYMEDNMFNFSGDVAIWSSFTPGRFKQTFDFTSIMSVQNRLVYIFEDEDSMIVYPEDGDFIILYYNLVDDIYLSKMLFCNKDARF